jgi:hypothetical protein
MKLYHKDKHGSLRCLVGNVEDHLDLLSHPMLCKRELSNVGIECHKTSPVFGVIQGNIVDGELKKRYNIGGNNES